MILLLLLLSRLSYSHDVYDIYYVNETKYVDTLTIHKNATIINDNCTSPMFIVKTGKTFIMGNITILTHKPYYDDIVVVRGEYVNLYPSITVIGNDRLKAKIDTSDNIRFVILLKSGFLYHEEILLFIGAIILGGIVIGVLICVLIHYCKYYKNKEEYGKV